MSKFHVGDRVRINQEGYAGHGLMGTVEAINLLDESAYPYLVKFDEYIDNLGCDDIFTEDQLRPANIVALSDGSRVDVTDEVTAFLVSGKPSGENGEYQEGDKVTTYAVSAAVDVVNHPPHYNRFPVEVINITEQLDFNRGNAVKYLARAGFKEGVDEMEDLSKAAWYVNRAIEKLTKERDGDV